MTFKEFMDINRARCEAMAQQLSDWLPSQWSNAMAGECGEACNITKKMDRIWPANQFKQSWNKPEDQRMNDLNERLKRELGDVVIYADLLASRQGLTLEDCVRTAFNEKSAEIGATHLLPGPARLMYEIGVEGDRFNIHHESPDCRASGCVPVTEIP